MYAQVFMLMYQYSSVYINFLKYDFILIFLVPAQTTDSSWPCSFPYF